MNRRAQLLQKQLISHKQQIGHAQKEWGDTHSQLEEYRHRLNQLSKLQKEASYATKSQLNAANDKVRMRLDSICVALYV